MYNYACTESRSIYCHQTVFRDSGQFPPLIFYDEHVDLRLTFFFIPVQHLFKRNLFF